MLSPSMFRDAINNYRCETVEDTGISRRVPSRPRVGSIERFNNEHGKAAYARKQ